MTGEHTSNHPSCTCGHLRAQHTAMTYHWDDAYEREKAAIKAYEDGWDDWDGPIWPWRETNHSQADLKLEEEYVGCCDTPTETPAELGKPKPVIQHLSVAPKLSRQSSDDSSTHVTSLWAAKTKATCPVCGGVVLHPSL